MVDLIMLKNERIKVAFGIGMFIFYLVHIMVFDYYINDLTITMVPATANSLSLGFLLWVFIISDLVDDTEKVLKSDEK